MVFWWQSGDLDSNAKIYEFWRENSRSDFRYGKWWFFNEKISYLILDMKNDKKKKNLRKFHIWFQMWKRMNFYWENFRYDFICKKQWVFIEKISYLILDIDEHQDKIVYIKDDLIHTEVGDESKCKIPSSYIVLWDEPGQHSLKAQIKAIRTTDK